MGFIFKCIKIFHYVKVCVRLQNDTLMSSGVIHNKNVF